MSMTRGALDHARHPARPARDAAAPDPILAAADLAPRGARTGAEYRHAVARIAWGRAAVNADRSDRLMASAPPLPEVPDSEPGEAEVPLLPGEPEAPPLPDPV
jgi:hypothetical protein